MKLSFIKNHFSGLEVLQENRRTSIFFQNINLGEMIMCLEDLISYFCQPEDDMGRPIYFTFNFF